MQRLLSFLPRLWANWITLFGTVVTTLAGFALLVFALLETFSAKGAAYGGIFLVIIPMFFVAGLLIIPVGFLVERIQKKRSERQGVAVPADPIIEAFRLAATSPRARKLIFFVGGLTVVNVILISIGGVRALNYMDTPQFCGAACHTPMEPEYSAYHRSPHQKVDCVACHIGPGAGALVEAKLNGMHQLLGVVLSNYHRPIPTPVAHLRSSEITCEGCHARDRFIGDHAVLSPGYKPDKANSASFTAVLAHVGGLDPRTGYFTGIHSHLDPNRVISYEFLDEKRTRIGKITVVEGGQLKKEYVLPGEEGKEHALGVRKMECTDCHNRPGHSFDGTALQAVDLAMWNAELDSKQPYLAKVAVEVLEKANVAHPAADAYFKTAIESAYGALDARPVQVDMDKAIFAVSRIYQRNVFPAMNVSWNTYPSLIGHHTETDNSAVGCFRCHDGKHQTTLASGLVKKMDKSCDLCHANLASGVAPEKFDDATKQLVGIPLD